MIIFCNAYIFNHGFIEYYSMTSKTPAMVLSMSKLDKNGVDVSCLYNAAFSLIDNNIKQDVGSGITYMDPNIVDNAFENPQFDIAYMNLINSNDELFIVMMGIMINIYEGYNVIIKHDSDVLSFKVVESLIKIIQIQYGYNCTTVNDIEDFDCVLKTQEKFSKDGILKLDKDRNRYQALISSGVACNVLIDSINKE